MKPNVGKNILVAKNCVALFNQKQIEHWVDTCYAKNSVWIELPRPSTPDGQSGDKEFLKKTAAQVLGYLPDRRMEIINLVAQDDQVVLEIDWQGTTAVSLGNLPAGSKIQYRVATFLTFFEGMIIKEIDYCIPIRN